MDAAAERRKKHAEYMLSYYRNKPEAREKRAIYAKKHNKEKPEVRIQWLEKNKDHIREYNKRMAPIQAANRQTIKGRIKSMVNTCTYSDKLYKRNAMQPITIADVWNMYEKQDGKCFYTGVALRPEIGIYQMSIDRIDSKVGHSVENCVLTTLHVNRFKGAMTTTEFRTLINNIKFHSGSNYTPPDYDSFTTNAKDKIGNLMGDLKRRAKKANLPHELTLSEFKKWRISIGDRCQITGVPVTWEPHQWNTGSVDRIDSSKGYTLDNVQLVIWPVNMMKNDLSHDDAIKVVNYILAGIDRIDWKSNPVIEFSDDDIQELLSMV